MAGYRYLNVNPQNLRENDCVIRAITFVSKLPYDDIKEKLWITGKLLNCTDTCVLCYRHLIESVFGFEPMDIEEGLYPAEFAEIYPYGTYLVRMNGHIAAIQDGEIVDSFDSRYYGFITDAWRVD